MDQNYGIDSNITSVVCINLAEKWRQPQFKFFNNFSWQFYLLSKIWWKRKTPGKFFCSNSFYWRCLACGLNQDLMPNKSTHCLLDYGDFHYNITAPSYVCSHYNLFLTFKNLETNHTDWRKYLSGSYSLWVCLFPRDCMRIF